MTRGAMQPVGWRIRVTVAVMRHAWRVGVSIWALGCGDGLVASPFGADELPSVDAGHPVADAGIGDPDPMSRGPYPSETLGGPCVDDAQCDDGIACTFGSCDPELKLCRFTADHMLCADDVFCNGVERCDPRSGCRPGPPTSCSDSTPCTIDRCDEQTKSCVRSARDVDGDGVVDGNCEVGGDCNDLDPLVSSSAPELCRNGLDDDCDGEADEGECQVPRFDTCDDAFEVDAPGSYLISPAGAVLDYGASCATGGPGLRDLALLVTVPEGPAVDVDIVARASGGSLSLARAESCGGVALDAECLAGAQLRGGQSVGRLRLRSAAAGVYAVYLFTDASSPIELSVSHEVPSPVSLNRSCNERLVLEPGQAAEADLLFAGEPLPSGCPTDRGELFYEFSVLDVSDVRAVARSLDGLGEPRLSLRDTTCAAPEAELRCHQGNPATLRLRALEPGTYVLGLSASGATEVALSLELLPPSTPPPADQCPSAPSLTPNRTEVLSFVEHVDDIAAGCRPGAVDTARRLALDAASDVLLVARFSPGDLGAVALAGATCDAESLLGCTEAGSALARVSERGLAAGAYAVVVESALGLPATVVAATRPAAAPRLIPTADGCADAVSIGAAGGLFQGNTSNATPDFTASCDFATPAGSPDQLLRLSLETRRRVILDMRGSDFETLLNVRRGPACPGEEVPGACTVLGGDRSFLDLDLAAGDYFVQIDGYAGASGTWFLNVFVLDP